MGRWERYLPIAHLAEAAGIRDALATFDFSAYEGPVSLIGGNPTFVCAVRGKRAKNDGQTHIGPVGQLYACVYGDKWLVGEIYGHDLDYALGPDDYSTYFEDIDPALVESAKTEHPSLCAAAQERMNVVLNHLVIKSKLTKIESRASGLELRPKIAKFLLMHGPATQDDFSRGIDAYGYPKDWYDILTELENEGFLDCKDQDDDYYFSLSEAADEMLSEYEPIERPATPEDKVILALSEESPLDSKDIVFRTGSSKDKVRRMLRKLIDKGVVETEGSGRARMYKLAG